MRIAVIEIKSVNVPEFYAGLMRDRLEIALYTCPRH